MAHYAILDNNNLVINVITGRNENEIVDGIPDWETYYGSSPSLKEDIEKYGKDNFTRTILRLCKTRGECNYFETKYIFDNDAILREDYYNSWVSCKIQSSHVKNLIEEFS